MDAGRRLVTTLSIAVLLLLGYFTAWVVSARGLNAGYHRVISAHLRSSSLTRSDVRSMLGTCRETRIQPAEYVRLGGSYDLQLLRNKRYLIYKYEPVLGPILPGIFTINAGVYDASGRLVHYTDFD